MNFPPRQNPWGKDFQYSGDCSTRQGGFSTRKFARIHICETQWKIGFQNHPGHFFRYNHWNILRRRLARLPDL
jgi:hypothetical protein